MASFVQKTVGFEYFLFPYGIWAEDNKSLLKLHLVYIIACQEILVKIDLD